MGTNSGATLLEGLFASLYAFTFLLLSGLTLFIVLRGWWLGKQSTPLTPHSLRLRRFFLLLVLCLLLWQVTLLVQIHSAPPHWQLWLGRLNFSVMVPVPVLALRFVQEVGAPSGTNQARTNKTGQAKDHSKNNTMAFHLKNLWPWCWLETLLLALLTLGTPWVSQAERVEAGQAITTFGPLLPLYGAHVVGYLGATLQSCPDDW